MFSYIYYSTVIYVKPILKITSNIKAKKYLKNYPFSRGKIDSKIKRMLLLLFWLKKLHLFNIRIADNLQDCLNKFVEKKSHCKLLLNILMNKDANILKKILANKEQAD